VAPEGAHYRPTDGGARASEGLANFLGWFSVGLGLAQLADPGRVARFIGVNDDDKTRGTMRAIGLRELASGVSILSRPRPAGAVWSRVAGDTMDLALLGKALSSDENDRGRTAAATAAVLGITALDVLCAQQLSHQPATATTGRKHERGVHAKEGITVRRPVEEVYGFWHNFENFPRFMRHLESVQVLDDRRSHWKAKAPTGIVVEWDAETTEDRPNELIAWRSLEGSDVFNEGRVFFSPAPGNRGTEVRVEIEYRPPGGVVTAKLASLFRDEPGQLIADDLHHFKQVMETGDIVLSDATVVDRPHSAQPPKSSEIH
jgi:uncharacterized membrane protein